MATENQPKIVILAGPNGAGKSTSAFDLLRGVYGVEEFVNADVIAAGLSAFAPETTAISAGRVMLKRLDELAGARKDFAFETTLATRSFAPWLKKQIESGYRFHLAFLWLPSPELAVARVAERVRTGGHDVPTDVIERRYYAGIENFFSLYRPLAHRWKLVHNIHSKLQLIAFGNEKRHEVVYNRDLWNQITQIQQMTIER